MLFSSSIFPSSSPPSHPNPTIDFSQEHGVIMVPLLITLLNEKAGVHLWPHSHPLPLGLPRARMLTQSKEMAVALGKGKLSRAGH